jgi:hypothetical protein
VPADERRGWSGWCFVLRGLAGAVSSWTPARQVRRWVGAGKESVGWAAASGDPGAAALGLEKENESME